MASHTGPALMLRIVAASPQCSHRSPGQRSGIGIGRNRIGATVVGIMRPPVRDAWSTTGSNLGVWSAVLVREF